MRPCNQCRQPVENNVVICDDCNSWNESHQFESLENNDEPPTNQTDREFYSDYSYAILMGIFSMVITALFALIGLAVNDFNGFVIGGSVGLVIGIVMFTVMIRM